jgi:DNA-directed RNA polymerase subunit RPC12/RpoP
MGKSAEYKCLQCGFEWVSFTGPNWCPACGHNYVKWVNYKKWKKHASKEYRRIIDGK